MLSLQLSLLLSLPLSLLLSLRLPLRGAACTTFAAGRLASADGSVLVTQSDDGDGAVDARLVAVPARGPFGAGAMRSIYPDSPQGYPRFVGTQRGAPYAPTKRDPTPTRAAGAIPEIRGTTYAYYEGDYGMLNAQGVAIGEVSACVCVCVCVTLVVVQGALTPKLLPTVCIICISAGPCFPSRVLPPCVCSALVSSYPYCALFSEMPTPPHTKKLTDLHQHPKHAINY
jgi:hypothetical protein